ncbi:sodium-dependent bicarbonate transport family permease [Rhizobium sp. SGZ-381]|uniref:sodium-dependent bicarbonate transport family permease n=1 Tax=Rhizobium sp. SGZ-381 TaxID=3342800 RepID=UPI00366E51DC
MDVFFSIAQQNILSAPILFFVLGFAATLAGGHLSLPDAVSRMLALYLMLAIGFKGGAALTETTAHGEFAVLLVAGIALSALTPLLGYGLLGRISALPPIERAAVAAHYGSISVVTFAAATDALTRLGITSDGFMVAVAAAMETPAIFCALLLIFRRSPTDAGEVTHRKSALVEVFLNVTIVILLGSFLIGFLTGKRGMTEMSGFIVDPYRGALCLFLLDLGTKAAAGLRKSWHDMKPPLLLFALAMPLAGALLAAAIAWIGGASPGNTALLITLAASSSYIAAPAAMRIAAPEARPAIYLGLSLGITFPFNLIIGLPIYFSIAGV